MCGEGGGVEREGGRGVGEQQIITIVMHPHLPIVDDIELDWGGGGGGGGRKVAELLHLVRLKITK